MRLRPRWTFLSRHRLAAACLGLVMGVAVVSARAAEPASAHGADWRADMADCLIADAALDRQGTIATCGRVAATPDAPVRLRAEASRLLGGAYLEIGAPAAARDALSNAIALDPDAPAGYALRGALALAMGDAQAALRDFDDAIRRAPAQAPLREARAVARMAAGEESGALADWLEAHRLDPTRYPADPTARLAVARGARALANGDCDDARREAVTALLRAPGDAAALGLLGAVEAERGSTTAARSAFMRAMAADPRYATALKASLRARGFEPSAGDEEPSEATARALDACFAAGCRLYEDPRFQRF